jgi:hypothetical protein
MKPSLKKVITDYFKFIAPERNEGIVVTYLELTNRWEIVLVCPEDIYYYMFERRNRLLKSIERKLKTQMEGMFPYKFDVIITKE